jgi:hypothetical protein
MTLSDDDDDRQGDDLVTASEVIQTHGYAFYQEMLSFAFHHTDERGNAFWTEEAYYRAVGLLEIENGGSV